MKKIIQGFFLLLVLAAATQVFAAFESAKLDPDNPQPGFPLRLTLDGVTEGRAILAAKIDTEGKLTDSLVLAYTHEPFAQACASILKKWKATPARLDGVNVPVQVELTFDFKREGFVETSTANITNHFLHGGFEGSLEDRLVYRVHGSREIDRVPTPVTTVNPLYARKAAEEGVRGKVKVDFYIDEKGEVRFPSVKVGDDLYLSDLAVTALRNWRFTPPTYRGDPVLVAASQEFNFNGTK